MLIVSGDTVANGEEDISEWIRIIETKCWDEREEWWNYTPKDKRDIINRQIRYTRERSDNEYIIYYMWFEYLILWYLELGFAKDETQAYKKVSIATRRGNLNYLFNMKILVHEFNTNIQH